MGYDDRERVQVVGFHLAGAPPVGHVQVGLRGGLTALYGKNGAGKTRLLEGLQRVLKRMEPGPVEVDDNGEPYFPPIDYEALPSPIESLYYMSGVHLRCPVTPQVGAAFLVPLESAAKSFGFSSPATSEFEMASWDEIVLYVMSRLPFEASAEDAEYLLDAGCWIVGPFEDRPVTLCDPNPFTGPLQHHWAAAAEEWTRRKQRFQGRAIGSTMPILRFSEEYGYGRRGWFCELDYGSEISQSQGGSGPPPGLPPLPDVVDLEPFPDWFAFPVASVCAEPLVKFRLIREESGEDIVAATVKALPYRFGESKPWATESAPLAGATTDKALEAVRDRANSVLAAWFDEPPLLRAKLTAPSDWMKGRPAVQWLASTEQGDDPFPIDSLGQGHRRYAHFAIQRALESANRDGLSARGPRHHGRDEFNTISFAFIDEPEAALNPSSEVSVARGLRELADHVFVATHSTVVVDNADQVYHVVRGDSALVNVRPLTVDLDPERRQLEARRLGQTPGTLALLTKVVLLVEGPMDEAIIAAFVETELRTSRTLMLPLMGTKTVHAIPDAPYLFNSTDAPVLICLDNTDARFISKLRDNLVATRDDAQRRRLLAEAAEAPEVKKSAEMRTLKDLLSAASQARRLDRVHVFGFRKSDIVQYLDVNLIKPGATSWSQLLQDFEQSLGRRIGPGDGASFKKFVGSGYTVKGVEHALDRMRLDQAGKHGLERKRPIEFTRLADLLQELSRK